MYSYRDPKGITTAAVVCVGLYLVADLLVKGATAYVTAYASGALTTFDPDQGDALLAILAGIGIALMVAFVLCVAVVGRWIYVTSANAHTFSDEMTISPAGAVGWYFVPIMNLFKPFQAMRETWLASHYRGNWHGEPTPGIIGWWWGLWIVTNILGNISFRMGMMEGAERMAEQLTFIDLVTAAGNVALCIVLVVMMRAVAEAQRVNRYDETFV